MDTYERLKDEFSEFISQDDLSYYFYIHDEEGVFTYISPEVSEILGYTQDEFREFYMNHVTANDLNREMIRYTQQALKGIQQEPYKVEVYDKEYHTHLLFVYERPVFENDEVVGIEGVAKLLN